MTSKQPIAPASLGHYPAWTDFDLGQQFARVETNGWLTIFRATAQRYDFPVEVLLGIASRESNIESVIGDGGHGYGIMQIDDRSFSDWCHCGSWRNPTACIRMGVSILDQHREMIVHSQGVVLRVGGDEFAGKPDLSDEELLRTTIASYNCGLWAYYGLSVEGDPDFRSTGRNYSADTLARAAVFKSLL
jgi:hypothetical protein